MDPRASRFLVHFLAVVARLQTELTRVLRNAKLYKSIILSELHFLESKFLSSFSELRYSTYESTREKHSRQHWTNRTRWNESYKVLNSAKHRLRTYITIIGTFLPPSVVQCSYDVKLSLCEIYAVRSFNRPHFFLSLSKLACVPYEFEQRLSSTTFF